MIFPRTPKKQSKPVKINFLLYSQGKYLFSREVAKQKTVSDIVNNFNEISGVGLFYTLYQKAYIFHARRLVAFETVRLWKMAGPKNIGYLPTRQASHPGIFL